LRALDITSSAARFVDAGVTGLVASCRWEWVHSMIDRRRNMVRLNMQV
jgi:hypothetical protein